MKILAFGHRRRVGKDLAAKLLMNFLRSNYREIDCCQISFADELKIICQKLYGWAGLKDREHYENFHEDRYRPLPHINKSPVDIWIEVGNKMREVYSGTWIDLAFQKPKGSLVIVRDLRYPNEFDKIKQLGGHCIKINRADAPVSDDVADNTLAHLPDSAWDSVIDNNGTTKEFNDKVISLLAKYIFK